MAAAYAALVSLNHLIEQIQLYHSLRPFFLDQHQSQLVSLHQKVTSLQDLLEGYSRKDRNEVRDLENQITDAAYAAEDVIELYIVSDIQSRSRKNNTSPVDFTDIGRIDSYYLFGELQRLIGHMDFIEKEMMMMIEEQSGDEDRPYIRDLDHVSSLRPPTSEKDAMVGFEDELKQIMNKLTGRQASLQIISVTGMGGIGKSTLAGNVFDSVLTVKYFDIRGWITISQEFNAEERLLDLLKEIGVKEQGNLEYHQLGEKLYKHLSNRRFLIIVDDIWTIEAWDKLKLYLPDNNNGSRIILTTRLLNVASYVGSSEIYKLDFLDDDKSWSLLRRKVFVNENCPRELERVGRKIAENCKGLPLSISVIGGLLANLQKTRKCWEKIAGDIHTIVTSEEDERCLKILSLSYNYLPIHLKPCFLYMGVFPEDRVIPVFRLIDLWVVEGFLKPCREKSLEEVAQSYLQDLVDRNLIHVTKIGYTKKIKFFRIHDLLRDLCLREATKERFLHVTTIRNPNTSQGINHMRRIAIHQKISKEDFETLRHVSGPTSGLRSLISHAKVTPSANRFRLLRVSMNLYFQYSPELILKLINSRVLQIRSQGISQLYPIQLLWNLQILTVHNNDLDVSFPVWEMPLLRKLHVVYLSLPDNPRMNGKNDFTLANLHTMMTIKDLKCTSDVFEKIPNLKKLILMYSDEHKKGFSHYCLKNLVYLTNLQSLDCALDLKMDGSTRTDFFQNLEFPLSLKKLNLWKCSFEWEDLTTKVGSLPHLEKLKLYICYTGEEWNLVEEKFVCLRVLKIRNCTGLERWSAESIHFPCLEHLRLEVMEKLEDIPSDLGDISSLELIQLNNCGNSVVASAKKILREQQSYGNEVLCVLVNGRRANKEEEEEEEEHEDQGKAVHEAKKKKRNRGLSVFVIPFLIILGSSFVLNRNKLGRGEKVKKMMLKVPIMMEGERRKREDDDFWYSFYDYP